MLERLTQLSRQFLRAKYLPYHRYFIRSHKFNHRLIIILGSRGVGKTTTLIQLLLKKVGGDRLDPRILYVQADHFAMGNMSLYQIAEEFQMQGGKWLAIDEIHKYPEWSKEIKSIYDTFPDLELVLSGSSALEIHRGTHDLTRRSICYKMQGLSFREYLELLHGFEFSSYTLEEICAQHELITEAILSQLQERGLKIIPEFNQYLHIGYYPYFFELKDPDIYRITLEQNFHTIIESDLAAIYPELAGNSVRQIKQLLVYIATSVPFIPNWTKIKTALEIGDARTLKSYFSHLEDACLIRSLTKATKKFSKLESADKVYADNTNQLYAISANTPEKGTLRETFFLTMCAEKHEITLPGEGDFLVDDTYLFEVGGKQKDFFQIKNRPSSYLVLDDVEQGINKKIPLWLFGFLY